MQKFQFLIQHFILLFKQIAFLNVRTVSGSLIFHSVQVVENWECKGNHKGEIRSEIEVQRYEESAAEFVEKVAKAIGPRAIVHVN